MPRTSVSLSTKRLEELNVFQSTIILQLEGKSIDKDEAIALLIAGYKNPDFDEVPFLASLNNKMEVAESVS